MSHDNNTVIGFIIGLGFEIILCGVFGSQKEIGRDVIR